MNKWKIKKKAEENNDQSVIMLNDDDIIAIGSFTENANGLAYDITRIPNVNSDLLQDSNKIEQYQYQHILEIFDNTKIKYSDDYLNMTDNIQYWFYYGIVDLEQVKEKIEVIKSDLQKYNKAINNIIDEIDNNYPQVVNKLYQNKILYNKFVNDLEFAINIKSI